MSPHAHARMPLDMLRDEHEVILRVLTALEGWLNQLEAGKPVRTETLRQAVQFFRGFADGCHHHKEEELLFPKLEEGGPFGPVAVMLEALALRGNERVLEVGTGSGYQAALLGWLAEQVYTVEIIPELIETGIEELEHFQQVYAHMARRGIRLAREMAEDPYIKALLSLCHTDRTRRFLDRLLIGSIIECRGAERFRLVCQALDEDAELKAFYHRLWTSEAKHGNVFVKMALEYFPREQVYARLQELNRAEGEIIGSLTLRPALH